MYPFLRMGLEILRHRRAPRLGVLEAHVSRHTCLPWDLDPWNELNNGRTLTLYDLGRIPFAMRSGIVEVMRAKGWGMTVAGSSVRYRRRIRMFQRVTMVSRCLGWDARFFYLEQSMWRGGECANHMLLRSAVTDKSGIVAPSRLVEAMAGTGEAAVESPPLPEWAQAWIAAEAQRPWPPEAARFL